MILTSACLALVLHCPPVSASIQTSLSDSLPSAYDAAGGVLPFGNQMSGDCSQSSDMPREVKIMQAHTQQLLLAEADLNAILPGAAGTPPSLPPSSSRPAAQPTYQSWDVLRQYPRYVSTSSPSGESQASATKSQETAKESKGN